MFRTQVCYSQGAESITKTDGVGHRVSDPLCCEVRKHLQLWNHHKSLNPYINIDYLADT
jgi:hypothetical protein